ncbi:phage antirepressor N-terminal domain-containing protein [Photorhabdus bodei]|uniref:phage antirepressor N-terminal domain-containing protein n=1 Tax=Photorhabdus bodei TaxID=2029681 RepID=UPI0032B80933
MSSIAINETHNTINVPFHGVDLYVVNYNGEPYTPMKPIIDGMGMDWASQFTKLKQRFTKGIAEIAIPTKGGNQSMTCLALRKLAGWLSTVSPNKVKVSIRDKVIQYQEECDDVLYEYWTKGEVKKKVKTTTDERTPLRDAVNMLVGRRGLMYPEAYSFVHQRFNVSHIDQLPAEKITEAVEYVHKLALEGEYLGKETSLSLNGIQFPENGKILITMRNSTVDSCEIVRPDSHVLTLNTFMELAQKAGYLIIHRENFLSMENSWKY